MGKKIILLLCLILTSVYSYSQEFQKEGLLKAYLTISPAMMLENESQPFYFHGNLEGYTSSTISLAGDGYFYLGDLNENGLFRYHNSLFAGFNWHILGQGAADLFIGAQPGISFTTLRSQGKEQRQGINPLASLNVGFNHFLNEYFNFFILGKTVFGRHATHEAHSLNEVRLSAGLGFSLPVKRGE